MSDESSNFGATDVYRFRVLSRSGQSIQSDPCVVINVPEEHTGKMIALHTHEKRGGAWAAKETHEALAKDGAVAFPLPPKESPAAGKKAPAVEARPAPLRAAIALPRVQPGSVIAPPKKSKFLADEAAEEKWFHTLAQVEWKDLVKGDLILRKVYGNENVVRLAQKPLQAGKGTRFSVHALVYVGDGKAAQAMGSSGVKVMEIKDGNYIAWRASSKAQVEAALKTAEWLCGQSLKYSTAHCFEGGVHSSAWGPLAEKRHHQIVARELPAKEMMCSEFASFCYQSIQDDPYVKLDAMRVAPMKLEDFLNQHPGQFRFAGAVQRKGTGPDDGFEEQLGNAAELYGLHKLDPAVTVRSVAAAAKKVEKSAKDELATLHKKAGHILKRLF